MQPTIQVTGKVRAFLSNPKGQTDGLLLEDGEQLHFPPHWGDRFKKIVRLEDEIEVIAEPGHKSSLGQEFRVLNLTHTQSRQMLDLQSVALEAEIPKQPVSIQGTVDTWIVGHKGELKGLLLADGAQLYIPKPLREKVTAVVKLGDTIVAEGIGICHESGTSIEVTALTINGISLLTRSPEVIEHHEKAAHHHSDAAKHYRAGDEQKENILSKSEDVA
jgi:hypothetical protein